MANVAVLVVAGGGGGGSAAASKTGHGVAWNKGIPNCVASA